MVTFSGFRLERKFLKRLLLEYPNSRITHIVFFLHALHTVVFGISSGNPIVNEQNLVLLLLKCQYARFTFPYRFHGMIKATIIIVTSVYRKIRRRLSE